MITPTESNTTTVTLYDERNKDFNVTFSTSSVNGRSEVTKIIIEANGSESPITQKFLRSLPISTTTRMMRRKETSATGNTDAVVLDKWKGTDEQLQVIADLYREAYRTGVPVQPYLATKTGRPVTTVNRWVREARKSGHLGKSNGTRAGEWS